MCVAIRKSIRNYFNKIANENIVTNINFWEIIQPFPSNKGHLENVDIINPSHRIRVIWKMLILCSTIIVRLSVMMTN